MASASGTASTFEELQDAPPARPWKKRSWPWRTCSRRWRSRSLRPACLLCVCTGGSSSSNLGENDDDDDVDAGVATLELNDPVHYNGLGSELLNDLMRAVAEVHRRALAGQVHALVLQGVGPHFCTGANMGELEEKMVTWSDIAVVVGEMNDVAAAVRALPIPTLCAVHGKMIGGGVALALAADWRVADRKATYNFGNLLRARARSPTVAPCP